MRSIETLPSALKVRIVSYLSPRDAIRLSQTSKTLYEDLALAQIPMKIPFKSWYDDNNNNDNNSDNAVQHPKRGPKIPFLPHRTHSVTLTGSWSCRLGELQGRQYGANSQAQFFIVGYPLESPDNPCCYKPAEHRRRATTTTTRSSACRTRGYENATTAAGGASNNSAVVLLHEDDDDEDEEPSWLSGGGRIVWASRPLCRRHYHQANSNSSWVKLTVTFVPSKEEEYYLCIQPGPSTRSASSQQHWWRHSLHMSNLIAHIYYHDNPHTNFLMKRQYQSIVKHILKVENRASYYTNLLEATARSIRIQLARFGRNALDPVLESFFASTGIPRDTDSLLVLEEIARFLSCYAYVNERRMKYNNSNTERDSAKGGATSSNRDSVPDWVPYAESSIANRSSRGGDFGGDTTNNGGFMKDDSFPSSLSRRGSSSGAVLSTIPTTVQERLYHHHYNQRGRHDSSSSSSRGRIRRTVQSLWKLPNSLWRSTVGGKRNRRTSSWRTDEMTEEFSISVVPPDEILSPPPLDQNPTN